ncbi:MAG: TonB-dependent receptor [Sphingomonas sp.]|uniref:TonB-dependent receptor plug domain-containing protein n=1 Tax=Sphingomonas sp. TaxID=28214 RepID=UPI0025EBB9F7|nr:TonB-dependent receptor [Sphingomonas sp.]MBY0283641.1 TonB-dependent receptor [Sphingomonas sp.]
MLLRYIISVPPLLVTATPAFAAHLPVIPQPIPVRAELVEAPSFLLTPGEEKSSPSTSSGRAGEGGDGVGSEADRAQADTVVVTANRSPEPVSRIGQSVTVIDAEQLAQRQTTTVAELLRTVPGVSIIRNGGIGGTSSVFVRGAESDQTVALIDGVKLNDPSSPGGGFNFGNLLVGNIERVEVLRGPSSVLWGSQAIGGVVNLITVEPTKALQVNARGEYGYRNSGQLVGNLSGKAGPLSISAGGGWFTTDGISAFSEARGGRERDGYRNYGANVKLSLALAKDVSIEARGYYADTRAGFDGFAPPTFAFGDTREEARTRELVGYVGGKAALFGGRFRNRIGFAYTEIRRRSIDPDGFLLETFNGNGRNERFEYQGNLDITKGVSATFGLERETSRFTTVSFGGPQSIGRARIDSVYGQIVATPLPGLTLTGGVRHDEHDRFGGATSFAGSGVYSPNGGATTFRASYSEGFKAPSLFQLLSDFGNTRLRPERAKGWDAGVTQTALGGAVEASATYFRRTSTDLIDFINCPVQTGICTNRPFGVYDNVNRAVSQGVELTLKLKPVEALSVQANYTYLDASNRSVGSANFGRKLVRRPGQSINASVDYRWAFGLSTGATVTHVGGSFVNASNSQRLAGYVLADLRAAYPVTRHIEAYGRIENLLDERYETVPLYGQLGRAAYIGVRVRY